MFIYSNCMNTTIIIDGNWLLMSRLFGVKSYFNVQNDDEEKLKGTAELEDIICRSINLVINRFEGVVNNIILVADGGSWRKSVEKPIGFDEVYKGNRVKDQEVDWTYIYKALEDVVSKAGEIGITACRYHGIEGDDWIQHWSRRLNNMGINCIIWSSDQDLKQLLQVKNGAFTAWLNESQKGGFPGLFLPKELDDKPSDDLDMFMQIDNSNAALDELRSKVSVVTYLDPDTIVEDKIICGDRGDNIKSVVQIKKGSKTYRITEAEWHSVKENLGISSLQDFFAQKDKICEEIITNSKYAKYGLNLENSKAMFDYNKILVWLNETIIPQELQDVMNAVEYKNYDLSYIKSNYKVLVALEKKSENVEEIFEGVDAPF